MAQLFEAFMVISFGLSWPVSIAKSLKAKTSKGKSVFFLIFIDIGYICGITSKFISGNITYVLIFYILNFVMVATGIMLYFRNRGFDKKAQVSGK